MKKTQITIKNYRCFDDAHPARIEIDNGIISFTGPNNSGKSSLLKMFREFRNIWQELSTPALIVLFAASKRISFSTEFINDPLEIFSDSNSRAISIEFEIETNESDNLNLDPPHLFSNKLRISAERNQPSIWKLELFSKTKGLLSLDENRMQQAGDILLITIGGNIHQVFTEELASIFSSLHKSLYIGPFRNAINVGATNYYDIQIGEGFINTWNSWKTGHIKFQNLAISKITEDIRHIFGFNSLEITASTQLKTLQININNKSYKLTEVGSGLAQFIVVFGSALINDPDIILIDEPELNLHPSLQIDFTTTLAKYAREATLMATHSIGLARSVSEHIYSFQRSNNHVLVSPFEKTFGYSEFLGEMSFSSYREMGFDKLLLVEGTTDVKTIQQFLRKQNKDHRIVVLPLGGDSLSTGNAEHELAELKRLSTNIAVLVDSEKTIQNGAPAKKRQDFFEVCIKLGFKVHMTERRATENYLTDAAVKEVIGDKYRALNTFERLEDAPLGWKKAENWRIANSMSWEDIAETDVGKFIESL
ncbi:MAG: AAA family ATPase [Gallionellaceae bacterium]|jgi:ABC-type cobalamin/Fe3+-siderophores transport system ATPase subunit